MQTKILLGCPVSSPRSWILPTYLKYIKNLQFDKKQIILYFLANNITGDELTILKKFRNENKELYMDIIIDKMSLPKTVENTRDMQTRQTYIYQFLEKLRNKMMDKTIELGCSHFCSIDSDILVKEDLLNRLLTHNKHIVASLLYNGYLFKPPYESKDYDSFSNAFRFPNILKEYESRQYRHIVNNRIKYPEKNPIGTLMEVDYTGACVLMTKEVCERTRYGNLIILNSNNPIVTFQGEDEGWSWSARQAGFKLYCDISLYSQHVMSSELLERFKDF